MASNFRDKVQQFMARRNGPDQLARDTFILAIVMLVLAAVMPDGARTVFSTLCFAALIYGYFRILSSNVAARSRENQAYLVRRDPIVRKISAPFGGLAAKFRTAASQGRASAAKAQARRNDKDHRYFACPKCKQAIRVPKGAGKIRVTCPKCGEKFEKKA